MSITASREKDRAIDTVACYLQELRAERPSLRLAESRSPKGRQTIGAILKAARAVFVRDGHASLTMRKVAAEAGVVVGNVSYYFPSKRALLEAMLREELADYVEEHIRHFEADRESPLDILLNVVAFYISNGRFSHAFFYQVWGYAGSDETARELVRGLYSLVGRFIYYIVKAARPSLSSQRIRQIVLQIFSLEEGLKLFIGMGPEGDPALETAEIQIRELTRRIVEAG
ncbi:MAG: TetR/AcrR family transcriptional regulator [Amphiplicatus sp.]